MSKTIRGSKGPGYEYWGRRYKKMNAPGRDTKSFTHKQERRQAKREVNAG